MPFLPLCFLFLLPVFAALALRWVLMIRCRAAVRLWLRVCRGLRKRGAARRAGPSGALARALRLPGKPRSLCCRHRASMRLGCFFSLGLTSSYCMRQLVFSSECPFRP